MAVVAALLDNRAAVLALRRSLPRGGATLTACRSPAGVARALRSTVVEAVVASPRTFSPAELDELRKAYPAIPLVLFAPFRPDDGDALLAARASGVRAVAVEGVDDAVVGDIVARHSLTAERRTALEGAPRALRLTEPLQLRVWDLLVARVDQPHPHRRGCPRTAGEPGAPVPPVRRRRRPQPEAGHRPHAYRLRRPAPGQRGLPSWHRGPDPPIRLLQPLERNRPPHLRPPGRGAERSWPSRRAARIHQGENQEQELIEGGRTVAR